jgi:hypothetical protein
VVFTNGGFDEAKAAGCFVESVEAHYKSLDLAAPEIPG